MLPGGKHLPHFIGVGLNTCRFPLPIQLASSDCCIRVAVDLDYDRCSEMLCGGSSGRGHFLVNAGNRCPTVSCAACSTPAIVIGRW